MPEPVRPLKDAVQLGEHKVLNADKGLQGSICSDVPVLVILAAGKGTRFGRDPKCIQLVHGTPLARHSVEGFRWLAPSPVICLVGYRAKEVSAALGHDNIYILSDNPAGGTAFAVFEAFSVPGLLEKNPLLVITMGDRIVPSTVFRRLRETHCDGFEADLTFLTAQYEPPRNRGKGRVLRDDGGRVLGIIEERDIQAQKDSLTREALLNLTEGNCPLYAIRARTLYQHLEQLSNSNAQGQYYLTDIIERISRKGGEIRTITTAVGDPEYDILCSDVTQPMDLALLEGKLTSAAGLFAEKQEVEEAARMIMAGRPAGQIASIAKQLEGLAAANTAEKLGFQSDQPVGIGIAGGRLRIAFMHPDMVRFFGPAWQMPIGAGDADGKEQIVMLAQGGSDRQVYLFPLESKYRESTNCVPSNHEAMYPGDGISDWYTYESFGTRVSEMLLSYLGYASDQQLEECRRRGQPLPPPSRWISNNMRRPFPLVGNAITSLRTLRGGNVGAKVQEHLGRDTFKGLRLASTGSIPQGGFSSSSAVIVATKNALNALFDLGIPPDVMIHLACQAEYGTGVRAGSLDQATEQKGKAAEGTLISSNPRDNYRIIGMYPAPTDRFRVLFPYTVERDLTAWRWSWGFYGEAPGSARLTTGEMRKMTGKAAELAGILTRLPLETDFFKQIEEDLVTDGQLGLQSRAGIAAVLRQLPLLIPLVELQDRVFASRDWYISQLEETLRLDRSAAEEKADATFAALFAGWREPVLTRDAGSGKVEEERGVPLRAMVAYLFGEVAKNFYLIFHPEQWIEYVTRSQQGDQCYDVDPQRLPSRDDMLQPLDWENGLSGPALLDRWLERHGATPRDFNLGLDDASLSEQNPPEFHRLEGSNFFRGLALIDLAEAMLKRAFGSDAVAVRVNAAGQGDYFQVHVDTQKVKVADVEQFIRQAFYRRFDISPDPEFVVCHPGGGALGVRLTRYDTLPQLVRRLRRAGNV